MVITKIHRLPFVDVIFNVIFEFCYDFDHVINALPPSSQGGGEEKKQTEIKPLKIDDVIERVVEGLKVSKPARGARNISPFEGVTLSFCLFVGGVRKRVFCVENRGIRKGIGIGGFSTILVLPGFISRILL